MLAGIKKMMQQVIPVYLTSRPTLTAYSYLSPTGANFISSIIMHTVSKQKRLAIASRSRVSVHVTKCLSTARHGRPCNFFLSSNLTIMQNLITVRNTV